MIYESPSGIKAHVLKEYRVRREFSPVNWGRTYALQEMDCIQSLASGLKSCCEGYEARKNDIAIWLKEEIPASFHPRFVASPPSRRRISGELATAISGLYECYDISRFFCKKDAQLKAGERSASPVDFKANVLALESLDCIENGDAILIVDDVFSTGQTMDAMKNAIMGATRLESLSLLGAAILKV